MIAVKMKKREIPKNIEPIKDKDVIVLKIIEEEDFDDQGNKIIKRRKKQVNLTKLINETAKIAKQSAVITAEEKLKEMQKIFTK